MYEAHQKYGMLQLLSPSLTRLTIWLSGDTVRLGPNRILSNTCEGLHGNMYFRCALTHFNLPSLDIYTAKDVKKSKGYLTIIPTKGAYSVHTAINKGMHRRKRMVISQGLSHDVLRTFEPSMMNHVRKFCDLLVSDYKLGEDGWTSAKNMTDFCESQKSQPDPKVTTALTSNFLGDHLTFDIMGSFGFGKDFQMQEREENRFLIKAIAASNIRTSIYGQFPELAKYKLEKVLYPKGYAMRQKFLDLTRQFASDRLAAGAHAQPDLFSFIVDAQDPETGEGFSLDELWSESKFLIVAGEQPVPLSSPDFLLPNILQPFRFRHLLYRPGRHVLLSRS